MSRKEAKWCFLRRKNSSENGNFRKMPSQEVKRWRLKTKWGERWKRRKKMEGRKWGQEMFHGTIQTTDKSEDLERKSFFFHSFSLSHSVFRFSLLRKTSSRDLLSVRDDSVAENDDLWRETKCTRHLHLALFSTLSLSVSPMLVVSCHDIRNLRRGRGTGESHVRELTCSSHILVILCFCYVYHHESLPLLEVNELRMSRDDSQEENKWTYVIRFSSAFIHVCVSGS